MFDSDVKLAKFLRQLSKYSGLVFRLSVGIVAGFFGGGYLDRRWGTEPLLSVAGVLVGLLFGLVSLYREAMKEIKKD